MDVKDSQKDIPDDIQEILSRFTFQENGMQDDDHINTLELKKKAREETTLVPIFYTDDKGTRFQEFRMIKHQIALKTQTLKNIKVKEKDILDYAEVDIELLNGKKITLLEPIHIYIIEDIQHYLHKLSL